MAKNNYINSGVSDDDLIKWAYSLQESQLAVPEKTTWDYIQEDLNEWQAGVKERTAAFIADLPEEFDLNKIEPQGREAVGKWFEDMRKEYTAAANKTSIFDPGSYAYTEGTSKLNKIEDDMATISGLFDNMKEVRTNAIKNKDNVASRVSPDQQALMNAIISGDVFNDMEIKDGGLQFRIPGATYPDGQDYFTEDDIKNLPTKGSTSESAWNGIIATIEGQKQDGVSYKPALVKDSIVKALNAGRETGENMDMMFDVAGTGGVPYVRKWLDDHPNDKDYKTIADIQNNINEFYNANEADFIDNFLMPTGKNIWDTNEESKETLDKWRKLKTEEDKNRAYINKVNAETSNLQTKNASLVNKKTDLAKQTEQVNSILADNPDNAVFNYGEFKVEKKGGRYNISKPGDSDYASQTVNTMNEMKNIISFDDSESENNEANRIKQQKNDAKVAKSIMALSFDGAMPRVTWKNGKKIEPTFNSPQLFTQAVGKDAPSTVAFIDDNFGGSVKAVMAGDDLVDITINGVTKRFTVDPNITRDHVRAQEIMTWIHDKLK